MGKMFKNDYSELAHPRILNALNRYACEQNEAYGLDYHSENAKNYILNTFGSKSGDVYFLLGGTQTNLLFISYALKQNEGVISPDTGHINVHETAAVEGSGHKIITIANINGKISASQIQSTVNYYGNNEHMVKPKLVYISNSTEIGTIYTKKELLDIYDVCKKNNLYFFIDGARLGSALTSEDNDVDPILLGSVCDAFYVGGAKNGLMFGEALVINNPALQKSFRYHIKNKGALLAKGYAIGIQFEEAFKDGLYFEIARQTNEVATYLKNGLTKGGLNILPSPTNQVFVVTNKKQAELFIKEFSTELWEENDEQVIVRFVTSFLTTKQDVDTLLEYIRKI